MSIRVEHIVRFLERVNAELAAHREELTRLDSAIGDADHGTNLQRGFTAVVEELPKLADKDIGAILKGVGMKLVSTVGGASGPLYGTAFIRAGMSLAGRAEIDDDALVMALEAALEGIQARGKAQRGEKTMIDTIAPAVDALKEARANGADLVSAMRTAVAAAEAGMQSTVPMLATKGRASYLGDRSIGHQDPGATSAYLIVKVMLEVLEQ